MGIRCFPFGKTDEGNEVTAWQMNNGTAAVTVLNYGATVQSLLVPDKDGKPVDVVLGYDTVAEYQHNGDYLGATIGRFGNRIGGAGFSLNGRSYSLAKNDGENHLHGGDKGFDKRMWSIEAHGDSLVCSRLSPDGEEGYPGNLSVTVIYSLVGSSLNIRYEAVSDADTVCNLTNHSYFNLNGGGSILNHRLRVNSERFLENDAGCLPTGRLLTAAGTPFDFRSFKSIGRDIDADDEQLRCGKGYDHNFVLCGMDAAELRGDKSGISMRVRTDLPGVQVYSANCLSPRSGKGGKSFGIREALCLETQLFPNGMARYGFPSPVLRFGVKLESETTYLFGVY